MESVSAIILAGGRGSRLGGVNKALLDVGGTTTLDRVRAALVPIAGETILVVNDDSLTGTPDARILWDPEPYSGVLPALLASLEIASHPLCVLLACDMPFLNRALLHRLVDAAIDQDVVLPLVGGQLQPMHAVYRGKTCRAAIVSALARGERRMVSFLEGLRIRQVDEAELRDDDPDLRSFFNINTAQDLTEARRLAAPAAEADHP